MDTIPTELSSAKPETSVPVDINPIEGWATRIGIVNPSVTIGIWATGCIDRRKKTGKTK